MNIALVIGTRPQIIKSAPIIHAVEDYPELDLFIIHTGQHYDFEMSKGFFNELDLPDPIENLGVGSGSHAWQTGNMMIGLETAFRKYKPDVVMVPGDTNSTLAGAIAAAKLHIPVAHVEAGARSFDMKMPEEVNRRLTDHCSNILFTVSENCNKNLLNEGISNNKFFLVGDTMYESIMRHSSHISKDNALEQYNLNQRDYAVLTLHRPENVDDPSRLQEIACTIMNLNKIKIIFPCHPRTKMKLQEIKLYNKISSQKNIRIIDPVGYYRMLNLIKNAKLVLTDSGGMQKEAFWLNTPCLTLRENTEWIETIELGCNKLIGDYTEDIKVYLDSLIQDSDWDKSFSDLINPYYFNSASTKILELINEKITKKEY